MIGRTNCGVGGGGLNFQVVGGTTQPEIPKENTIWVNTDTDITSYVFSATNPSNPSAGMVWIVVGASSTASFPATSKNPIMVYPIGGKQYVGGVWVDKTAKSYQNGTWVDWILYLYKPGDECINVTGGWIAVAEAVATTGKTTKAPTVAKGDSYMSITPPTGGSNGTAGMVRTSNAINISSAQTLIFEAEGSGDYCYFDLGILNEAGTAFAVKTRLGKTGSGIVITRGLYSVDVSGLSGSGKVAIECYNANSSKPVTLKVHNVYAG